MKPIENKIQIMKLELVDRNGDTNIVSINIEICVFLVHAKVC